MTADGKNLTQLDWVTTLLGQAVLARIATADPRTCQPHVVPVWFEWDGEYIWISSFRSTRKIREIKLNPLVSIVIDVADGLEGMRSIIFEGAAELITDPEIVIARSTSIYTRYLGEAGVRQPEPASWIIDPENMLICLNPGKVIASGG
jgi:nitroimidazol reductase NimA-like FMN-containing flavoprotein (pyridoxamine 5'-phosphate oxidase superfamily)